MQEGYVTQIGYPPLRIDILNTIDGVKFEDAFPNKLLVDDYFSTQDEQFQLKS